MLMTKPIQITEKTLLTLSKMPRKKALSVLNGAKLEDGSYQFTKEQADKYMERVDELAVERRRDAARLARTKLRGKLSSPH